MQYALLTRKLSEQKQGIWKKQNFRWITEADKNYQNLKIITGN